MSTQERSSSYGQYCPLALAAELLCRRWTVLVISRLIDGCETFSEIHRGVPRISPSLLSTRLKELESAGIVNQQKSDGRPRYVLTEAGRDLEGIVNGMAVWGQHWARDMDLDDLDVGFLAWSMHMRMNVDAMPAGRTVLRFEFSGAPADSRRFWLVHHNGVVDMCMKNPGYDEDIRVEADLRLFVEAWRGIRDMRREIAASRIQLHGPRQLRRAFPEWLLLSGLAPYPRKAIGDEHALHVRSASTVD